MTSKKTTTAVRQATEAKRTADKQEQWEDYCRSLLREHVAEGEVPDAATIRAAWTALRKETDESDRQAYTAAARAMSVVLSPVLSVDSAEALLQSARAAEAVRWEMFNVLKALKVQHAEIADILGQTVKRVGQLASVRSALASAQERGLTLTKESASRVVQGRASGKVSELREAIQAGSQDDVDRIVAKPAREPKRSGSADNVTGARNGEVAVTLRPSTVLAGHVQALKDGLRGEIPATDYAAYVQAARDLLTVARHYESRANQIEDRMPTSERPGQASA